MKAGGVKFADTPDEAAAHDEAILELEINGHMPRGVLVEEKAAVAQEYYAGVTWDGRAQAAGDALQRHGRHRHRGGRRDSTPTTSVADALLDAPADLAATSRQGGDRARPASPARAQRAHADRRSAVRAVPRLRPDAGRDQPAGAPRRRPLRRARRPHGHGGRGARPPQGAARRELGIGDDETRQAREADAVRDRAARRSTRSTTAASPATSSSSTATSAS